MNEKTEWERNPSFPNDPPPVVMLPGAKATWTVYSSMEQFKRGDHHELFSEDDPIVPVLLYKGFSTPSHDTTDPRTETQTHAFVP